MFHFGTEETATNESFGWFTGYLKVQCSKSNNNGGSEIPKRFVEYCCRHKPVEGKEQEFTYGNKTYEFHICDEKKNRQWKCMGEHSNRIVVLIRKTQNKTKVYFCIGEKVDAINEKKKNKEGNKGDSVNINEDTDVQEMIKEQKAISQDIGYPDDESFFEDLFKEVENYAKGVQ